MITCKINVKRIDKNHLFKGDKGTYLDITLIEKPDDYGNAGFVSQKVSKEAFQKGEKGPIIGNWRRTEKRNANQTKPSESPEQTTEQEEIPF